MDTKKPEPKGDRKMLVTAGEFAGRYIDLSGEMADQARADKWAIEEGASAEPLGPEERAKAIEAAAAAIAQLRKPPEAPAEDEGAGKQSPEAKEMEPANKPAGGYQTRTTTKPK